MRRLSSLLAFLLAPLLVPAVPLSLPAQGWVTRPVCDPVPCQEGTPVCPPRGGCGGGPPVCPVRGCRPLPVVSAIVRTASDVRVELADRVLRYEVTEKFTNRGAGLGEADYFFPLPAGAAFQDLKLSINGELVAGEVLDASEARRVYEEIVRRQRDPALLEWAGSGMLRARIFPIAPGEVKTVVVRFQSVARREGDALRVDYARGGRGAAQRGAADAAVASSFVLTFPSGEGYGTPYSPTHTLRTTERRGERRVEVDGASGDVTVLLPVTRAERASVAMLPHAPGGGDGFALVTVTPPARPAHTAPRDVTFVVDVSGSMSGTKLEQAKAAGRQLLATLDEHDRFRVVDFSTDVRTFRDDFVPATRANIAAATRYVDALEAQGSTNIAGALERALDTGDDDDASASGRRLPLVLFVTDGEPTVGERDPDALAKLAARLRGRRRVFTFGLGADVNAALLERVALEGRGTAHFVRPEESVERVVTVVASRLTSPVATDVTVRAEGDGGDVRLTRVYPGGPVDLFAGQDLVLLARYSGDGPARVVVEGRGPDGAPVRWASQVRFPERERANAFVARLWATQRVGYLSAERRQHGPSAELDAELRDLGERYGIPTELTSYFVQEPGMVANGLSPMRRRDVAGGGVGAVASPAAAAPAAADRQQRFESAKRAAEQRLAVSLADVGVDSAAAPDGAETRRVDGRLFTRRGEVWTDSRQRAGIPVVRIRAYGAAWFRLAELLPDVRDALALGERVIVAGRSIAIEVAPEGAERISAVEEKRIVEGW